MSGSFMTDKASESGAVGINNQLQAHIESMTGEDFFNYSQLAPTVHPTSSKQIQEMQKAGGAQSCLGGAGRPEPVMNLAEFQQYQQQQYPETMSISSQSSLEDHPPSYTLFARTMDNQLLLDGALQQDEEALTSLR